MTDSVDCVVIGAGVVGLSVARSLALAGQDVLLIEACNAIGTQISAPNSEVVHAGIYYAQGSLKAELCVKGREMLYDYCARRDVAYKRCGVLIVATHSEQLLQLESIRQHAVANGVHDLELLEAAQVKKAEPALHCLGSVG